jgi:hypothetical protein
VTDLDRYISANDFLLGLEERQQPAGSHEAGFQWLKQRAELRREDMDYLLEGMARLRGPRTAEPWNPKRPELDRIAWAWHRAWIDRYGPAATNEAGLQRYRAR